MILAMFICFVCVILVLDFKCLFSVYMCACHHTKEYRPLTHFHHHHQLLKWVHISAAQLLQSALNSGFSFKSLPFAQIQTYLGTHVCVYVI